MNDKTIARTDINIDTTGDDIESLRATTSTHLEQVEAVLFAIRDASEDPARVDTLASVALFIVQDMGDDNDSALRSIKKKIDYRSH